MMIIRTDRGDLVLDNLDGKIRVWDLLRHVLGPIGVAVLEFGLGHVDGRLVVRDHRAGLSNVDVAGHHSLHHLGVR